MDPALAEDALRSSLDSWFGRQVHVAYQATRPGIAAPLGWVLSMTSQDPMDLAMKEQKGVATRLEDFDSLTCLEEKLNAARSARSDYCPVVSGPAD